ncbi:hypothetical protein [Streptomyces triculaminicus]|uniref:hypothetical protein n=1 Tax=Streptomyces triculaminicus TaxID=2816232 RepID=UPI0035567E4F
MAEQRAPDGAVPVLLPLASWNPAAEDLYTWLAAKLTQDYVGLRGPAPACVGSMNWARALLEHRLILPILDGLDELPRPPAPWRSMRSTVLCPLVRPWWSPAVSTSTGRPSAPRPGFR